MATDNPNITPVIQGAIRPEAAKEIASVAVMTERLKKLKKEWEDAAPQVYVDDTLLFTESWKETEQMPVDFRWAKAFQKRMENCEILIRDPEIIVGSSTKFIRGNNTLCAVKPHEILLLTFTNKAAREMIERVNALLPGASEGRRYLETTAVISSWSTDGTVRSRTRLTMNGIAYNCFVNGGTGEIVEI